MVIIMVRILMRIFQVLEPPQSEDGDDSATGGLSGDYDYDDNGDFFNCRNLLKDALQATVKGVAEGLVTIFPRF